MGRLLVCEGDLMCCGRETKSGATIVYQHHVPGEPVKTYSSEADAQIARTRAGGQGAIIRTTQPVK